MYAVAATAAGVGVLALAPFADAKIVYTPANITIAEGTQLDLNHDGINDFQFYTYYTNTNTAWLRWVKVGHERGHNRVIGTVARTYSGSASALRVGAVIGPKGPFTHNTGAALMARETCRRESTNCQMSGTKVFRGQWANGGKGVKNRYLGLKFFIMGRAHFGWARLKVTISGRLISTTMTGYAYETVSKRPIIAGQTKGPDEVDNGIGGLNTASLTMPTPEPAMLGMLALGEPALAIWRRKEPLGAKSEPN
jgi:hypothetical protein